MPNKFLAITAVLFTASFAQLSTETTAAEIRIPLPELLGSYEANDFGFGNPGASDPDTRSTHIVTGLRLPEVEQFSIELEGILSFGEAVGDGRFREPERISLPGHFSPAIAVGGSVLVEFRSGDDDEEGPFQQATAFLGSDVKPPLPTFPQGFDPLIQLALFLGALMEIPYVNPPQDPVSQPDSRGVLIPTPLRGEITSAFLVIQTDSIPEPSTLALCGLAAVLFASRFPNRRRVG